MKNIRRTKMTKINQKMKNYQEKIRNIWIPDPNNKGKTILTEIYEDDYLEEQN